MSLAMVMPSAGASRIPVLAAASFATATQSFVFAGLLAEMAADLAVTVAAAGQLGTAYALAFGLSAPLVAAALARRDRRSGDGRVAAAAGGAEPGDRGGRRLSGAGRAARRGRDRLGRGDSGGDAAAVALAPPEQRGRAVALVIGGHDGWPSCSAFRGFGGGRRVRLARLLRLRGGGGAWARRARSAASCRRVAGDAGGAAGGVAALRVPGVVTMLALNFAPSCAVFAVAAYIGPVTNAGLGPDAAAGSR